jgi:hypothetical protein
MGPTQEKKIEHIPRPWRRWVLWAAIVAAAVAAGVMTAGLARDRAKALGRKTVEEAVALMDQAREARAANRMGQAEELLGRVRALLARAEPRSREPLYTTVLVDLASIKIAAERPTTEAVAQARDLLNEAWSLAGRGDVGLRHRIATTRGLTEILGGDLLAARQWYEEALALVPADEAVRAKLMILEEKPAAAPPAAKR